MPPHNSHEDDDDDDNDDKHNSNTHSSNDIMAAAETLASSSDDKKAVPTILTTAESQEETGVAEVAEVADVTLTPPSAGSTGTSSDKAATTTTSTTSTNEASEPPNVVDPWAHVVDSTGTASAPSSSSEEGEGEGATPENKKTLGQRWGSFRNRVEKQWQEKQQQQQQARSNSNSNSNPDEPAATVIQAVDPTTATEVTTTTGNNRFARFFPPAPKKKPTAPTNTAAAAAAAVDPSQILSADDMATFRASRISVTLQKESRDSKWGFGMDQDNSDNTVKITAMVGTGLLEHAPFQVGDTLVSVNNKKCTHAGTTVQELVKMEGNTTITLVVETPQGNPNLVQAMVRKPSADAKLGIGFYTPTPTTAAAAAAAAVQEQEEEKKEEETKKETESSSTGEEEEEVAKQETTFDSEVSLSEPAADASTNSKPVDTTPKPPVKATITDDPTSKLLRINNIDADGLLSHSVLSQGDIVVAINATPCSQMTPAQAEELLQQSNDSVTIIAMKPPSCSSDETNTNTNRLQRWMKHAKRGAIALGGGTMVGVGLIFIPTLPPPFGEVLIVGGVSVLGTEFEAPKRVMRSARDALERSVGREGEVVTQQQQALLTDGEVEAEGQGTTGTGDATSLETSETALTTTALTTTATATATDGEDSSDAPAVADKQQPPKKTMGDRFKNFGRRHVLPFLDQVVGDRKEEEKKEESSSSSSSSAKTEDAGEETSSSAAEQVGDEGVATSPPEESTASPAKITAEESSMSTEVPVITEETATEDTSSTTAEVVRVETTENASSY